jgi:DnaJ-domain-containing protein 1
LSVFDRLGNVLKSYLNDDTGSSSVRFVDPDLVKAYKELDDFLNEDTPGDFRSRQKSQTNNAQTKGSEQSNPKNNFSYQNTQTKRSVPENLRADFFELGVEVGAAADVCKTAHKNLLKIHHPDKHAGSETDMKTATEKTKRINAAYERITKWYENSK